MSGDWARRWKPQFDQRLALFFEMHDYEMGDASFNTPHQGTESASFHAMHNPTQVGPDWPVLEKGSGWHLSLASQRRLPRYLSAVTLFSDGNRVTRDHFEYWRCTGAYASLVSDLPGCRDQIMETLEDSSQSRSKVPGSQVRLSKSMLNDLCLLLQIAVLGDHTIDVKMPEYAPGRSKMDPVLERLVTNWSPLAATYGFPVLEGLLKEQRGEPNDDDDTSFFWSLKEWVEQIAYLETKETIVEIDKLQEVDTSGKPGEVTLAMDELVDADSLIGNDHLIKSNVGLLWDLRGQRNDAQHRNQMVRGVAVVIVTLCCLVFWDAIGQEEFQSLRRDIRIEANREENRQREISRKGEFYPESFYDSHPRFARWMGGLEFGDRSSN